MRMRRKKHGAERIAACSELLIEHPELLMNDPCAPFSEKKPLALEIGCGKGAFACGTAAAVPEVNMIAMERVADVACLALEKASACADTRPDNLRFIIGNAENLPEWLPAHCLDTIYLNFSDPWPKSGYKKRRLTHRGFLEKYRDRIDVPIVCNCGGYEPLDALRALDGLVDIYLPDFKYYSPELSAKYSHAHDYFEIASLAISEMHRQQPRLVYDGDLLKKGLVVRHLVLPGCRKDSIKVLDELCKIAPTRSLLLSLMSQYTPDFVDSEKYPELGRRVTSFEYESVKKHAIELGFEGFFQLRDSASAKYTPKF